MKKILALILAALLIFCMVACSNDEQDDGQDDDTDPVTANQNVIETTVGSFEYGVNESGEYEITKYTPPVKVSLVDIEIPKTTPDGRDITAIGDSAFKADNSLRSVIIPDTYKSIGDYAFYGCEELVTVTMTDNVTEFGVSAFQNCAKLSALTLSKSVVTISANAFRGCVALTAVDLSGETVAIEEAAFFGCTELTTVTLSDKIESVVKNAFLNSDKIAYTVDGNGKYLGNSANPHLVLISALNLNIEDCTVNANTKVIADGALSNCSYLEKVTLGANVKVINATCFENSPYIEYTAYENARYLGTEENPYMVVLSVIIPSCETLTLHADVKVITESAFSNCDDLANINYPKTTADWDAVVKDANWCGDKVINVYKAGDAAAAE